MRSLEAHSPALWHSPVRLPRKMPNQAQNASKTWDHYMGMLSQERMMARRLQDLYKYALPSTILFIGSILQCSIALVPQQPYEEQNICLCSWVPRV